MTLKWAADPHCTGCCTHVGLWGWIVGVGCGTYYRHLLQGLSPLQVYVNVVLYTHLICDREK